MGVVLIWVFGLIYCCFRFLDSGFRCSVCFLLDAIGVFAGDLF